MQVNDNKDFQPLIVAFCCNWCSYAGADLSGTNRLNYPTNVKIIRVPCSCRVNPMFILRAFQRGADGVILCGSIDEVISTLDDYDTDDVFIIGGASVYAQMLPFCDTAYITKVDAVSPAEKYFPNLDEMPEWKCVSVGEENEYEGLRYRFTKYTKSI